MSFKIHTILNVNRHENMYLRTSYLTPADGCASQQYQHFVRGRLDHWYWPCEPKVVSDTILQRMANISFLAA